MGRGQPVPPGSPGPFPATGTTVRAAGTALEDSEVGFLNTRRAVTLSRPTAPYFCIFGLCLGRRRGDRLWRLGAVDGRALVALFMRTGLWHRSWGAFAERHHGVRWQELRFV